MAGILDRFKLDGKLAVVTGGNGKYGKQMVIALAEAGARVCIASRNASKDLDFADSLRMRGLNVFNATLDQGNQDSINDFIDRMKREGGMDILVNNAVSRGAASDHDWDGYVESLMVNGVGLAHLTTKAAYQMAEKGGGSIINIGSYMGILGGDDTLYRGTEMPQLENHSSYYFFCKGGMTNFTRFMAAKFGPRNVRVNVLQLGGLFNHQPELFVERYNDRTFLKRMANQTDVMGALVWLASDASAYITGTSIPVDGGYSAK